MDAYIGNSLVKQRDLRGPIRTRELHRFPHSNHSSSQSSSSSLPSQISSSSSPAHSLRDTGAQLVPEPTSSYVLESTSEQQNTDGTSSDRVVLNDEISVNSARINSNDKIGNITSDYEGSISGEKMNVLMSSHRSSTSFGEIHMIKKVEAYEVCFNPQH